MRSRRRIPNWAALVALVAGLAVAGCSGGKGGVSAADATVPSDLRESDVMAEPIAPTGAPRFCTDITAQEALVGLADALAGDPDQISEAVLAAADELDDLALPDLFDGALVTETVESLRTWASDPANEAATKSMSDALEALGEEVQELCALPVG